VECRSLLAVPKFPKGASLVVNEARVQGRGKTRLSEPWSYRRRADRRVADHGRGRVLLPPPAAGEQLAADGADPEHRPHRSSPAVSAEGDQRPHQSARTAGAEEPHRLE